METSCTEFFTKAIDLCKTKKMYPIITIIPIGTDQGMYRVNENGTIEILLTWGSMKDEDVQYNLATLAHELGHMDIDMKKNITIYDPSDSYSNILETTIIMCLAIIMASLGYLSMNGAILEFIISIIMTITTVITMVLSKLYYLKERRSNEYKADLFAVETGFGEVLLRSNLGNDSGNELLSTHPHATKRKQRISKRTKEMQNE